jgi:hypothetical protein
MNRTTSTSTFALRQFRLAVAALIFIAAVVLLAPYIGLGRSEQFALYKLFGLTRSEALNWLSLLGILLCILYVKDVLIRASIFLKLVAILAVLSPLVLLAPSLGLGTGEKFVLYKWLGLMDEETFDGLMALIFIFCLLQIMTFDPAPAAAGEARWAALVRSAGRARMQASNTLFLKANKRATRREWLASFGIGIFFLLLFAILLRKNLVTFKDLVVMHRNQIFIDYDIDWKRRTFSLGGNLLYQFGMEEPFNTHLSPLLGTAHILAPNFEISLSVIFFYLAISLLIWFVGWKIGLRPIPQMTLAGLVGLIATIPYGLDKIVPAVPPLLLISLAVTSRYWQEGSILSLTSAFLFFQLGQYRGLFTNLALVCSFAALCYVVLLGFSGLVFFSVPVIGFYCVAFLITAENKREVMWKIGTGSVLAALMLLTNIPTFFLNLYSYNFGTYFADSFLTVSPLRSSTNPLALLKYVSMMSTPFLYEPRVLLVFVIALATSYLLIATTSGPLRRFAIAVLFCEVCIVLMGIANAFLLHAPVALYYAEQIHLPFLVIFFVLFMMISVTRLDEVIRRNFERENAIAILAWATKYRTKLYFAIPAILTVAVAAALPTMTGSHGSDYPPAKPPSVEILANELALKDGGPFRGRVLTLAAMTAQPVDTQATDYATLQTEVFDILEGQYGYYLGNDHWIDLLYFHIPIVNEFVHWTSPVNFIFLRAFFGRRGDDFDKAAFFLRNFDERIARMIGIRFVATDADTIPGGTLVYRTMAGGKTPLRLFRIDRANLGQYSPTHMMQVATATEAIASMRAVSFDPERDAVVERPLPSEIVPGRLLSLETNIGPSLSIRAQSTGWSLLVLPFEYSHCLRFEGQQGSSAQLVPVNLQQTGLLFEHQIEAKIAYRFGPFDQPQCRDEDLKRADTLRLREAL